MTDKYVRDMNPQELRAHMRRLQAMRGWHDPLADSMYAEIQRLDSAIRDLKQGSSSRAQVIAWQISPNTVLGGTTFVIQDRSEMERFRKAGNVKIVPLAVAESPKQERD